MARASAQDDSFLERLVVQNVKLPNQAESLFNPTKPADDLIAGLPVAERESGSSDLDYLTVS